MKKLLLPVLAILLTAGSLRAQHPAPRFRDFNDFLESVAGETDEDDEQSALLEELQEKSEHPVNINAATREELLDIPFITEEAVTTLLTFREKYGPFYSVMELASLPGIGREMAEKLSFFTLTGPAAAPPPGDSLYRRRGHHDLMVRGTRIFPLARGYRGSGAEAPLYRGSPDKLFTRYRFEIKERLQAGFTADKDPGESFLRRPNSTGFDYYSAYLSFRVSALVPRVIIGDFTAGTGQGAVIWQGFTMPGSADILYASRNLSYVKPHTSSEENRFFRGMAASFTHGNHRLHLLLSSRKRDGHPELNSDSAWQITSLPTSGYHRTPAEAGGRKRVRETTGALFYQLVRPGLKAGLTVLATGWSLPLEPGDELYEKYYFRGRRLFNAGADYRWIRGSLQLYGEAAVSHPGGMALLQGVEARLHDQVAVVVNFRHFDRNYHAPWAGAMATSSRCTNETGLYAALRLLPAPGVILTASADWHHSPWILYTTAAPSSGSLCTLRTDLRLSPKTTACLRYRAKTSETKYADDFLYRQETTRRHNLRLQTDYSPAPTLALRWRVEGTLLEGPAPEKGILICHDLSWKPSRIPLTASFRTAWFHTGSYASAIYAYENDLLYSFSSLIAYGHGIRNYLNIKLKITEKFEAWIKTGHTTWFDRNSTGSGADERPGKSKIELKMQARLRF